jgi:medium-chain acyl-[acyl-carrier-protein] hydrolase
MVRLFCLPYAGAGGSRFFRWASYSPRTLEICPVLLPGRESRIWEQPYIDLPKLVRELGDALAGEIDRPFAFFGHSMGARVAFELARDLRARFDLQPLHLFASACRAPHLPERDAWLHDLPEAEFLARLKRIDHLSEEIVTEGELLRVLLPTIRADFRLCETYVYREEAPLTCPITALGGYKDEMVTGSDLEAWQHHTTKGFLLRMFPGGHLFLNSCEAQIVQTVLEELDRTLASQA